MARPSSPVVFDDAAMLVRGRELAAANDEPNPTAICWGTATRASVEKELSFATPNRRDDVQTVLAVSGSFTHRGRKPPGVAAPMGNLLVLVLHANGDLSDYACCTRDIAEFASAMHLKRIDR